MAKKEKGDKPAKGPKQLGIKTVVKPCIIGIVLLTFVQFALMAAAP